MDIKVEINIEKTNPLNEVHIVLTTYEITPEVNEIIQKLQENNYKTILGKKGNTVTIIYIKDVIKFYSEKQYNYCVTRNGKYRIRKKLYELEEILDKETFIRISNSCIINVEEVKYFDMNLIGNIRVLLKNGESEQVSKRRISQITKFLKDRRRL